MRDESDASLQKWGKFYSHSTNNRDASMLGFRNDYGFFCFPVSIRVEKCIEWLVKFFNKQRIDTTDHFVNIIQVFISESPGNKKQIYI